MNRTLSFIAGAALSVSMGAAQSTEPVPLNDAQLDVVTAGVGFVSFTDVFKSLVIVELIQEQKLASFHVETFVTGFSAVAEAEADAEGPNADAQTFTFAEITPTWTHAGTPTGFFKVNSLSKSIALVSNNN